MKTKAFILGLFFTCVFQVNAQSVFDKLANEKDVTTVRITKAILQALPDFEGTANINGMEISALKDKLDLLEVFSTEKPEIIQMMRDGIKEYKNNPSLLEEIMTVKEDDTEIRFFAGKENRNDKTYRSLIMFVDDGGEGVLMRLLGKFEMSDLSGIIQSTM
ncbi:DUF4252 domain-containing protein [Bacteroidales bacterium OttesenSCG-928-A17]|nr:DUF4252 domain-containing protein [Bacteroidales bacterium OttesenSCG-928-A17]